MLLKPPMVCLFVCLNVHQQGSVGEHPCGDLPSCPNNIISWNPQKLTRRNQCKQNVAHRKSQNVRPSHSSIQLLTI